MPEVIRLWKIGPGDVLNEVERSEVQLETKLEEWLEKDISILSPDLLVIGRQLETAYGGYIDLLCLNRDGDLVIVELKKGKTPREISAQVLDYASWVRDLTYDNIVEIAEKSLGGEEALEGAFTGRFGTDLPNVLNESHAMMVVGASVDADTERIIKYLSSEHGVSINAATFQHFTSDDGQEFLARVFLIEPEDQPRRLGKKRRNLTQRELRELAEENGVAHLYDLLVDQLSKQRKPGTTQSTIGFAAQLDGRQKVFFNLLPGRSSVELGLRFQAYSERIARVFGLDPNQLTTILPSTREDWQYDKKYPDTRGYTGYFRTDDEIKTFLSGLGAES